MNVDGPIPRSDPDHLISEMSPSVARQHIMSVSQLLQAAAFPNNTINKRI